MRGYVRTSTSDDEHHRLCVAGNSAEHTEYMRSFKVGTLKKMVSRTGGDSLASSGGETCVDRHTAVKMSVCDVTV